MARIRTIKPEFWSSEQIVECSPIARLLFVGLWCFADDRGTMPRRPRTIKMLVFPGDDFTVEQVDEWLSELETQRLIGRYEADGETYIAVTGWHHQKIERPTYKNPEPPEVLQFGDVSASTRRVLADGSPPEGNGMESKGREREKTRPPAEIPESLNTPEFKTAWGRWLEHVQHRDGQVPSAQAQEATLMNFARSGLTKAIKDIEFSIGKNARNICDSSRVFTSSQKPAAEPSVPIADRKRQERQMADEAVKKRRADLDAEHSLKGVASNA